MAVSRAPREEPRPSEKITITVSADLLAAARAAVQEGRASSLNAYIAGALANRVALDQGRDGYEALLDQWDEELGPPSSEDEVWARQVLGR